jgi:hypothetical protein
VDSTREAALPRRDAGDQEGILIQTLDITGRTELTMKKAILFLIGSCMLISVGAAIYLFVEQGLSTMNLLVAGTLGAFWVMVISKVRKTGILEMDENDDD